PGGVRHGGALVVGGTRNGGVVRHGRKSSTGQNLTRKNRAASRAARGRSLLILFSFLASDFASMPILFLTRPILPGSPGPAGRTKASSCPFPPQGMRHDEEETARPAPPVPGGRNAGNAPGPDDQRRQPQPPRPREGAERHPGSGPGPQPPG